MDIDEFEDACDGEHIARPHLWNGKPVCQRFGCNVMGTGDRCNDGECEGRDLPPISEVFRNLARGNHA